MKLYTDYKAPNPRRLSYFLAYKGLELDTEIISLNDRENLSEEFSKINPMRTLPTLVLEDGTSLTDTISICVYLDKQFPQKPLFGLDNLSMAQVMGWCHRIFFYGLDAVAEIFRNQNPFFEDRALPLRTPIAQNEALIIRGQHRLDDFWIEMNAHLKGRDYVVGDSLTQADIDAWLVPSFAKWVQASVPEHLEEFHRWHQGISAELPKPA